MAGVLRTRNWILTIATVGVLGGAGLVGAGMMRDSGGTAPPLAGSFSDAGAQAAPASTLPVPAPSRPVAPPARRPPTSNSRSARMTRIQVLCSSRFQSRIALEADFNNSERSDPSPSSLTVSVGLAPDPRRVKNAPDSTA